MKKNKSKKKEHSGVRFSDGFREALERIAKTGRDEPVEFVLHPDGLISLRAELDTAPRPIQG